MTESIPGGLRCYVCLLRGRVGRYAVTLVRGTAVCEQHIRADEIHQVDN